MGQTFGAQSSFCHSRPAIIVVELSCAGELSIMEGFLEEVMSQLRLKKWGGVNQAGRLTWLGGRDDSGWGQCANGGSGVKRHLGGEIHRTYPQCMSEMSKDVR